MCSAHHFFRWPNLYLTNARGEMTGVITEVRFSNPHVRYRADVTNAQGNVESWEFQAASVTAVAEQNWRKDTIKVGDVVKVEGQLGRNASKKLFIRGVELADGTKIGQAARGNNQTAAATTKTAAEYGFGAIANSYPVDITGSWNNRYKFSVTVDDLEPKPNPFTAEGKAALESNGKYDELSIALPAYGLHACSPILQHDTTIRFALSGCVFDHN